MDLQILEFIDQLDELIFESPRVPFTSNRLINEQDIGDLVSEIRRQMPLNISKAAEIIKQSEEILSKSKSDAHQIIEQAEIKKNSMITASTVYQQAEIKSQKLLEECRRKINEKNLAAEHNINEKYKEAHDMVKNAEIKSKALEINANNQKENILENANAESESIQREAIYSAYKEINKLSKKIESIKKILYSHSLSSNNLPSQKQSVANINTTRYQNQNS